MTPTGPDSIAANVRKIVQIYGLRLTIANSLLRTSHLERKFVSL
jgi:hypothetical protein